MTALPDGRFVVTWQDGSRSGGDTSSSAIRGQVFNVADVLALAGAEVQAQLLGRDDVLAVLPGASLVTLGDSAVQGLVGAKDGFVAIHGFTASYGFAGAGLAALDLSASGHVSIDITAGGAVFANSGAAIHLGAEGGRVDNAGSIEGKHASGLAATPFAAILGGEGADSVTNRGEIDGSVMLGGGADFYDGRDGGHVVNGAVHGGDGDDTVRGGDGHDSIDMGEGADTAYGIAFADLTSAWAVSGDAGTTVIALGLVSGSGSITLQGFDIANLDASDFIF